MCNVPPEESEMERLVTTGEPQITVDTANTANSGLPTEISPQLHIKVLSEIGLRWKKPFLKTSFCGTSFNLKNVLWNHSSPRG